MFEEKMESYAFESNAQRDAFISSVLNSLDNKVTNNELKEISDLLE